MGPPFGGDACTSWTLEAVSPFGVDAKERKEEKMLAVKIEYLSAAAECEEDENIFETSLSLSVVDIVLVVCLLVNVSYLVIAQPLHVLAVFSKEKRASERVERPPAALLPQQTPSRSRRPGRRRG